jgi:uroporphyrin-3 C-methyltransferase
VEAAVRVAMQQSDITGSAEPLVQTLKQADERLARYSQPRLERVRRAVAQDLERARTAGVTDIAMLTLRLDDAIRLVDDLPLLALPERAQAMARAARGQADGAAPAADVPPAPQALPGSPATPAPAAPPAAASVRSAATGPAVGASQSDGGWAEAWTQWSLLPLRQFGQRLWQEVKGLVRVSRIDQPEAMLVAPEQAWFLRENLKLRLLNARLALLSRHFDTAQSDLRDAQAALERYFDHSAPRVASTRKLVREVAGQARLVNVPRPEATLAAIATVTATAGR